MTPPAYNLPELAQVNSQYLDEPDALYGTLGKINSDVNTVDDVFKAVQVGGRVYSFDSPVGEYYYVTVMTQAADTVSVYRRYYEAAELNDLADKELLMSYTTDGAEAVTFKIRDAFTLSVTGSSTVYMDDSLPVMFRPYTVGTDYATGGDWRGVY